MRAIKIIKLLFLFTLVFCAGCASLAEKGLLPEVSSRVPPKIRHIDTIELFNEPIQKVKGIIRHDGKLNLFALDKQDQLIRLVIQNNQVTLKTIIGKVKINGKIFLDVVETPDKRLRVLAGNRQFIFTEENEPVQDIKNNRCEYFITANQRLYCTFTIPGKDIDSPKRTDVTGGIFILLPIVFWHNTQANKLVVAEDTPQGWQIRSVIEPESILDVNPDYLVGTDNSGRIRFSYHLSRGGGFFLVGGSGGFFKGPEKEWRYAKISTDNLDKDNPEKKSVDAKAKQWISVKGANVDIAAAPYVEKPFGATASQTNYLENLSSPLNQRYAIDPTTGDLVGILWLPINISEGIKTLNLEAGARGEVWIEVSGLNNIVTSHFDIMAADDLPTRGTRWIDILPNALHIDRNGDHHALIHSANNNGWDNDYFVHYLRKTNGKWSTPVMLGGVKRNESPHELIIQDDGDVFVVWTNDQNKVVGRWLRFFPQ